MFNWKTRGGAALLAIAISALAVPSHAADKLTLMFDWLPSGAHGAWYAGATNGCFADQNLDISLERGFGGVDTITKVASGVADLGMADLGTMMVAAQRTGVPVKALLPIYNDSPASIATLDETIKSIKDLEGRKLVNAPGDSTVLLLPAAMKEAGADFSRVQNEKVDATALFGLLMQGQADAMTTFTTTGAVLRGVAANVGRDLKLIHFGADLDIYGSTIFAGEKIAGNADLVGRFAAAAKCVLEAARENPASAVDALLAAYPEKERDAEMASANAVMDLIFDNDTYQANGFGWDMDKVQRTFELSLESQGLEPEGDGSAHVRH